MSIKNEKFKVKLQTNDMIRELDSLRRKVRSMYKAQKISIFVSFRICKDFRVYCYHHKANMRKYTVLVLTIKVKACCKKYKSELIKS